MTWRRRALMALSALLLLWGVAAAVLAENGTRIPPDRRFAAAPSHAEALARDLDAAWRDAEITASDGTPLRGWYFKPASWNGASAILLHGVADTRLGVMRHARLLLRHGYGTLLVDSRGHGSSGGERISYGVKEAGDVIGWTAWLAAHDSPHALYGLGESMGAAILLQSLARGAPFRAVVAEAPFATFRDVARDRVALLTGLDGGPLETLLPPLLVGPAFLYGRLRFDTDLDLASPLAAVTKTSVPILLIHSPQDRNIPPAHSGRLKQANPAAELWHVPGARHTSALSAYPEEFERRVIAWFQR